MDKNTVRINQQGSVLIVALFFILLLAAIGLSLILNTQIEHSISGNYSKTVRATFAGMTGLERLKAYLIYDYKKDPEGWNDSILVVPSGTAGSVPSTDPRIAGENYIQLTGYPGSSPFRPVLLPSSIQDFNNPALIASTGTPVFAPSAGYQLLLRAVGKGSPGASSLDPNRICLDAAGYTGTGNAYLGMKSRGMNLLEQCLVAADISVWNNIVFTTTPSSSGMGDVRVHGNVHLLGPSSPMPSTATTITVSGNAGWSNSYRDPGLTGPSYIPSVLSNTIDPDEDARTDLGAFIRVRNGLVAASGSPDLGTSAVPFEGAYGCQDCGGTFGFTSAAYSHVNAQEKGDYDIPADVEDILLVPNVTNQYQDRVVKVLYPNYSAFLKGVETFGGTTIALPGVQALQLGTALQTGGEVNMVFQTNTNPATNLAGKVLTARASIFQVNTQKVSSPTEHLEQTPLEPMGATDTPLNTVIDSSTDHANGKTFMLVAADTSRNIFVVYKEVEPYDRTVDLDLTGSGGSVAKHFRRQVHGFVYIPSMSQSTLDAVTLTADLDGNDRDENVDNQNSGLTALSNTDSQKLLRKVINALWLASQNACLEDTLPGITDDSCYNRPLTDGNANDGTIWEPSLSPSVYGSGGAPHTATLRALSGEGWMIGAGVIQTSDLVTIDRGDDVRFAGKFTLFAEDQVSGGNTGDFNLEAGPLSVNRYSYTPSGGTLTNYSFPCYNNLGFLSSHNVELGAPGGTHDQFAGAFFAQNQLHITKQIQILGAMVAGSFLFDGGGTPDWYQAMEMPKCLPPEMIGGDPIVLTKSQAFLER